jgi:hypothetical protein
MEGELVVLELAQNNELFIERGFEVMTWLW